MSRDEDRDDDTSLFRAAMADVQRLDHDQAPSQPPRPPPVPRQRE